MLLALQPWKAELSSCGPMWDSNHRRCRRLRSTFPWESTCGAHRKPYDESMIWPIERTMDNLLGQVTPSFFYSNRGIEPVWKDMSEFERLAREMVDGQQRARICQRIIPTGELGQLRWSIDDKGEAQAEMLLPRQLKKSDDLNVELDEASRTITVKARSSKGPANCRVFSEWKYSQTLDDSIDLTKLEGSVDFCSGRLHLKAPVLALPQGETSSMISCDTAETQSSTCLNGEEGHSQKSQPGRLKVDDVSNEAKDGQECRNKNEEVRQSHSDSSRKPGNILIPIKQTPIEIEDIGPDEDCDSISISSSSEAN